MLNFFLSLLLAFQVPVARSMSMATNVAWDSAGQPDTRPGTWGTADAIVTPIHFTNVPVGDRVRILKVYGDFISSPIGVTPPGTAAWTLLGLQTTAPDGSTHADLAADNCFLYVQQGMGGTPVRAPFNTNVSAGGLLQPDNTLQVKMAIFLNTTGLSIHNEASFVIVYQYEN